MGSLNDWAKKQSKTIILDDGETLDAVFHNFRIGPNPFDPEKDIVFYTLGIVQEGEVVKKIFKSTSGKAARFFDECAPGQRVRMTRHGTGSETTYDFELVAAIQPTTSDKEEPTF